MIFPAFSQILHPSVEMSNQGTVPYFQIDTAFQTGFIDKKMLWERQLYKIQNKIVITRMNIEDSTTPGK